MSEFQNGQQHDHKIDFSTNKQDNLSTTMRDNTLITRDNITTNSKKLQVKNQGATGKRAKRKGDGTFFSLKTRDRPTVAHWDSLKCVKQKQES